MPIGRNSKKIQSIISLEEARRIEEEAKRVKKSISKYIASILRRRRR